MICIISLLIQNITWLILIDSMSLTSNVCKIVVISIDDFELETSVELLNLNRSMIIFDTAPGLMLKHFSPFMSLISLFIKFTEAGYPDIVITLSILENKQQKIFKTKVFLKLSIRAPCLSISMNSQSMKEAHPLAPALTSWHPLNEQFVKVPLESKYMKYQSELVSLFPLKANEVSVMIKCLHLTYSKR